MIRREEKEWLKWREEYDQNESGEQKVIGQYCDTIEAELAYFDEHGLHAKFLDERGLPPTPQKPRVHRGPKKEVWSPDKERQEKQIKKAAIALQHLVAARTRSHRCVHVYFGRDRIWEHLISFAYIVLCVWLCMKENVCLYV